MKQVFVAFSLLGAFAVHALPAQQFGAGGMCGMPLMPLTQHPALLGQPSDVGPSPSSVDIVRMRAIDTGPPTPEAQGPKLAGKELKKAVAKVNDLTWYSQLGTARAKAKAQGKPILWLQGLGDLDGFA